jgi:hypothetical protein
MKRLLVLVMGALLLLGACQSNQTPQAQLQTNAALVTAAVAAVAVSVLSTPNLDPATADKIRSAVATVNAANDLVQKGSVPTGSGAQKIVAAIRAAAPVLLAVLSASSPEAIAINAALALLPTILTMAGVPQTPTAAQAPGAMGPAAAAIYLHGYTGR